MISLFYKSLIYLPVTRSPYCTNQNFIALLGIHQCQERREEPSTTRATATLITSMVASFPPTTHACAMWKKQVFAGMVGADMYPGYRSRVKFFVVLGRYMVFRISMSFAQLFLYNSDCNEPVTFDLSNVERGPRSNFWDHSQHFRTNGFCVIAPNRANFRVKCCFRDDIFTLSCSHLKTKKDIDI